MEVETDEAALGGAATSYAVAYIRSAALCSAINQRALAGVSETNAPKAVCDEDGRS